MTKNIKVVSNGVNQAKPRVDRIVVAFEAGNAGVIRIGFFCFSGSRGGLQGKD